MTPLTRASAKVLASECAGFCAQKSSSQPAVLRWISHWYRIWRASSRPLRRRLIVTSSSKAGVWKDQGGAYQIGHLDRRDCGLVTAINFPKSRACIRLFFGLGGQHAEDDRYPVVIRHPRNPAADLGAD